MSKQKIKKTDDAAMAQAISAADLDLAPESKKTVSGVAVAIYVRSLLQNWRQGTVACKGRADVAYSNKKPWKQKGTGRARAGSARSPLWRGGGVTFGPQPRTRVLKTSRQVKRNVLNSILFDFLDHGNIRALDWNVSQDKPMTSQAYKMLKNNGLDQSKVVLFLPTTDVLTYASFANIPNVKILFYDQANAYDLTNASSWLILKNDIEHFKKMVSQWI